MEFKITTSEIQQTATGTDPNKWKCTIEATGFKEHVAQYASHCGNWSPNKVDSTSPGCHQCGYWKQHEEMLLFCGTCGHPLN